MPRPAGTTDIGSVHPRPDTKGVKPKTAPAVGEHDQNTLHDPVINPLFDGVTTSFENDRDFYREVGQGNWRALEKLDGVNLLCLERIFNGKNDLDWCNRPQSPQPRSRPTWQVAEIQLDDERALVRDLST